MSPRRACNRVYYHFVKEASGEDREKFDNELYAPTSGAKKSLVQALDEMTHDE
jgi:hypothetical protein